MLPTSRYDTQTWTEEYNISFIFKTVNIWKNKKELTDEVKNPINSPIKDTWKIFRGVPA